MFLLFAMVVNGTNSIGEINACNPLCCRCGGNDICDGSGKCRPASAGAYQSDGAMPGAQYPLCTAAATRSCERRQSLCGTANAAARAKLPNAVHPTERWRSADGHSAATPWLNG